VSEVQTQPRRKTRRTRGIASPVADLQKLVGTLIKENQQLRRRIARLAAKESGGGLDLRGLRGLATRVERAVSSAMSSKKASRAKRKPAAPRRPVSPETAEKRRQALAKAREVRAANRAASVVANADSGPVGSLPAWPQA
jgi:hypothetical protein